MFESVLVANRGEIARRIVRTCDRLGVRTAVMQEGFLDVDAVIAAAEGCDAVHPGYGFLSENPALPRACAAAGLVFIGPSAEAMEAVGDKVRAKELAVSAGVPVAPTYGIDEVPDEAYPVLVKAVAGGGGRGMRVVDDPSGLDDAVAACRREAKAGFGDDRVFVEKYLPRARHVEVQLLGDVALGERECSLQRRHQKLIEEAPCSALSDEQRASLLAEASALARAAGYENAGTAEFLFNADDLSEHYFLEMNARLQVEHPVTELVFPGLDLVEQQLRIACGEPFIGEGMEVSGHAIEARVTAEDSRWLPQTGRVLRYVRPAGVRVDDGIEEGSEVSGEYDSMLAKVIVHGDTRANALAKLDRALSETVILGVMTNVGALRDLLALPEVVAGDLTTELVPRKGGDMPGYAAQGVAEVAAAVDFAAAGGGDGWRLGGEPAPSWWLLQVEDAEPREVVLPAGTAPPPGWHHARDEDGTLWLGKDGYTYRVREPSIEETLTQQAEGTLVAPMPGLILSLDAAVGDRVAAGATIMVIESMKMELAIQAPADGEVTRLDVAEGDRVKQGATLAEIAT